MTEQTDILDESIITPSPDEARRRLPWMTRFWIWLLGPLFARIKFHRKNIGRIRQYLEKGAVVHVFQYSSYLEYLIFTYYLIQHGFPALFYPERNGFHRLIYGLRRLIGRGSGRRERVLVEPVAVGKQTLVFLQPRGSFLSIRAERQIDEIQRLLTMQKDSETPLYLMPHITIWSKRPVSMMKSVWDVFFGNSLQPGRLRRIIIFLRNFRSAFIRSGEAIRLSDWTSDSFAEHGKDPVKEIRWRLFQFFTEERVAAAGPMTKPRTWILESVLNSETVQEVIADVAAADRRPVDEVAAEAAKELDFMAADYKYSFVQSAAMAMSAAFKRLYQPVVIDEKGMERIREYLKRGPVVYVPSHKSHMDYLTWSWLCLQVGIFPPHIIAGENLSFWPMGFMFRRMGAIFIRRSFKGNRLYATLLRQYLSRMLWEGYAQEFFIEGGRSRTGKLLRPKFGILSIYVDAYLKNPTRDITFIPIALIYSKLIEEGSYSHELSGGEKKRESTSSLLKVFDAFKFRYGALYQQMGEPISIRDFVERLGFDPATITEPQRRQLIQELGFDVIARINQATTVTPSAVVSLALLASSRKGVTQKKLMDNVEIILQYLRDIGAPLSNSLDNSLFAVGEAIDVLRREGSIQGHTIGNEVVYTINDSHRHALDYYKNNILHYVAPAAYLAMAFLSFKKQKAPLKDVADRGRFLAELLRYEVSHSPAISRDQLFDQTVEAFHEKGILVKDGYGNLSATNVADRLLPFFQRPLLNFLESYWVVAKTLPRLLGKRIGEKKFLKLVMDEGRKMHLIGDIEHGEAYSKTNFQNAIAYFLHQGVLVRNEDFEDTTVTILPQKDEARTLSFGLTRKEKKAAKKKKRARFLELAEDYSSMDVLTDVAREIRFYLTVDNV